jgi:hypothetical protein
MIESMYLVQSRQRGYIALSVSLVMMGICSLALVSASLDSYFLYQASSRSSLSDQKTNAAKECLAILGLMFSTTTDQAALRDSINA